MVSQSEYFEETLAREDNDEYHVEHVENEAEHFSLLVVVQRHRHHVQSDEQHDDHVEFFVCHDFEDDRLRSPL